jgi:hypothetical protein
MMNSQRLLVVPMLFFWPPALVAIILKLATRSFFNMPMHLAQVDFIGE